MLIGKPEIARLIPHAGDMCLLDGVLSRDESHISCITETHRWPSNPLLRDGHLGILCGIEYAAQAMALHAALAGEPSVAPRHGYLASLRAVSCHADRLNLLPGPLIVDAERLLGDTGRMIYAFALRHENRVLLDGRAAVVLEPIMPSASGAAPSRSKVP
jgi:predicted hotdog family 3-hydroxylacyl-ACP dehydratase